MNAVSSKRSKGFSRWAALGTKDRERQLMHAVALFTSLLEAAGFKWVERCFDIGIAQANSINLEREHENGQVDFVLIIFDRYRRARFQVSAGTKEKEPPHRWVRAGALVWKKKDALVKYQWWGAKWWHLDKSAALDRAIEQVASLLPQLLEYLSTDAAGPNVWPSEIGKGLVRKFENRNPD